MTATAASCADPANKVTVSTTALGLDTPAVTVVAATAAPATTLTAANATI